MTIQVGPRLRAKREALRLSQDELARASGVAQPTISQIECGSTSTKLDTLAKLAEALGCSLVDLIGQDSPAAAGGA